MALNNGNDKTSEERRAYVNAQIAAGNPKYKPLGQWLNDNKELIAINTLSKKVDLLTEIVMKLSKSKK